MWTKGIVLKNRPKYIKINDLIMFKCSVYVLTVFCLQESVYSFSGDSCFAETKPGSCKPLSQCLPLLREIQKAGAPMPARLRRKLQSLSCGFQSDEPLVCCAPEYNVDDQDSGENNQNWVPSTAGMGLVTPSPWQETTTTYRTTTNRNDPGISTNFNSGPPSIDRHRNLDLLPTNCGVVESDRIWGGKRTRMYDMPWMVLVAYDSPRGIKLSCGGTLITERYVLTAAHCVSYLGNNLQLSAIVLGEYDVRSDPDCERVEGELSCAPNIRNATIDRVIAHPGYSPQTLFDDIALVRLAEPADFNLDSMKPICLPDTRELQAELLDGVEGTVAGWGATEDGLQSPVLLSVDLPVVNNKDCQAAYKGSPKVYDRQMCAGGVEDKDSCGGDSGGPLMYPGRIRSGTVRYVQRGIVSYGPKRCGLGGLPGVYTRIAYYMDWILDNIESS